MNLNIVHGEELNIVHGDSFVEVGLVDIAWSKNEGCYYAFYPPCYDIGVFVQKVPGINNNHQTCPKSYHSMVHFLLPKCCNKSFKLTSQIKNQTFATIICSS